MYDVTEEYGEYVVTSEGGAPKTYYIPMGVADFLLERRNVERDEELGRWRDPVDPTKVVYPGVHQLPNKMRSVGVLDERTGKLWMRHEPEATPTGVMGSDGDWVVDGEAVEVSAVAARFFAAHPLVKPWHRAKLGEFWVVTWDGRESLCEVRVWVLAVSGRGFFPVESRRGGIGVSAPKISGARKVWPVEEEK